MAELVRLNALRATAGVLADVLRRRPHGRWRKFLRDTWGFPRVVRRGRPVIWIVCAAGGEVVQAGSLGPALRASFPDATLILSTSHHAFLEVAQRTRGLDACVYTPWDVRRPCVAALRALTPDLVISVESAWNPVLLREARRRGAKTMLASGTMLAEYDRAAPYRRPMRLRVLDLLDLVGVKDERELDAFRRLGVPANRLRVLGDLRLDRAFHATGPGDVDALRARLGLDREDRVVVAGSVHAGEDVLVLDAARALVEKIEGFRLILAPRVLATVPALERACAERDLKAVRFTAAGAARRTAPVILLDTYGDLPRVYAVAHYAFLGGTLVAGDAGLGQNLVEPLVHGVPVFFGPHVRRWEQQTAALREVWSGLAVSNAADLVEGILELETSPETLTALRARAASLVEDGRDTADGHAAAARELLGVPEPSV